MARTARRTVLALVRMVARDYTTAERREEARDGGLSVSEIGRLSQYSAMDIAEGLSATEYNPEAYAGSGIFLHLESVSVLRAGFDSLSTWHPMVSAPKRREVEIDLLLHDRRTGQRWREADCHWTSDAFGWANRSGKSVCGKRFHPEPGRECFDPVCEDEESIVAQGWMSLPEIPAKES